MTHPTPKARAAERRQRVLENRRQRALAAVRQQHDDGTELARVLADYARDLVMVRVRTLPTRRVAHV